MKRSFASRTRTRSPWRRIVSHHRHLLAPTQPPACARIVSISRGKLHFLASIDACPARIVTFDRRNASSRRTIVVEPSQHVLKPLRKDEEFVLYRTEHSKHPGLPSVLLLTPTSTRPALETLKKIEHEYSLRDELDSAWAVRPSPSNAGKRRSCSKTLAANLLIDSFQGRWR
jgi:hypothetical protein